MTQASRRQDKSKTEKASLFLNGEKEGWGGGTSRNYQLDKKGSTIGEKISYNQVRGKIQRRCDFEGGGGIRQTKESRDLEGWKR